MKKSFYYFNKSRFLVKKLNIPGKKKKVSTFKFEACSKLEKKKQHTWKVTRELLNKVHVLPHMRFLGQEYITSAKKHL